MSDNKKYYYLKLKDNFYDKPEIKAIESMESGYEYISIMQKMYLRSLERSGKLMLTDSIPYDLPTLSKVLGHKQETVMHAVNIFVSFGLIQIMDDKSMYMLDIQKYIGHSSTEADRIRDYRKKTNNVQIPYKCTPELELELELESKIESEIKKGNKQQQFQKPTTEEINSYCTEIGYTLNADTFFDYYESKGWMIGKNKMKDWKAAIRTWRRNDNQRNTPALQIPAKPEEKPAWKIEREKKEAYKKTREKPDHSLARPYENEDKDDELFPPKLWLYDACQRTYYPKRIEK